MPTTINGTVIFDQADSSLHGSTSPTATNDVVLVRLGNVSSAFGGSSAGAESVAFENGKVYSTNIAANTVVISEITDNGDAPASIASVGAISLSGLTEYKMGGVNSVAVKNGIIAVAYENSTSSVGGYIALFNAADNTLIKTIQVGVLPDMVTFTPDGSKILVANEAERVSAGENPAGTISIIDLSTGAANASVVNTISFDHLSGNETALRNQGLNILAGQTAGADIEPEYITISPDGTRAYVTLQEVNGVAVIDLTDPAATKPIAIQPLGYVDWSLSGNQLDTSDRDNGSNGPSINLRNFDNLRGLLQPDAIASFTVGGSTYFVTANEGDARVPDALTDAVRLNTAGYVLDPTVFPNAATLKLDANLGRLNVLTGIGDTDGDGDYDAIYALGGRGITIFKQNADGTITKVRETGGEFEAITAALGNNGSPAFNSNQSVAGSSFDTRSDDKGPEPEGVTIGVVNGRTYAFVGLERVGGMMIYDVTDPANAAFVGYTKEGATDLGPEVQTFISAANSPTGQALLVSGNEISNTVTLYSVQTQSDNDDTINGGNDADTFNARAGNDTVKGFGGNDTLNGDAGDDLLVGGAGNDTINGGADTDTAGFSGAVSDYTITRSSGTITVVDNRATSPEGTDTLTNIETFSFSGGTISVAEYFNTAPDITSNGGNATAAISVAENTAAVTTVVASDIDAGTTLTYSLSGTDAALFDIDASTGALTFKKAPNFETPADAGSDNVYDVVVTASDEFTSDSQAIAVTVTDVADTNSSQTPYLLSSQSNVTIQAIITTGDATSKTSGGTYQFGGIPDGLGMFDNGDGTVTVLVNHEISSSLGAVRDHGAKGSYVSKLIIDKTDLSVISGQDAFSTVKVWNAGLGTYETSTVAFSRFCSADLAPQNAFYNPLTGLGTTDKIFITGEESGVEGKLVGILATGSENGTAYDLAALGKFAHENAVANGTIAQDKTIVLGTDDGTNGQVYVYVGTKQSTGSAVDKAGLTNGKLYGFKVTNLDNPTNLNNESNTAIPGGAFTLVDLGDVKGKTGAQLDADSEAAGVTSFLRPEDISWDPTNPARGYFVTTNGFGSPSRLYQFTFTDISQPELGGTITAVLDGTEGQQMLDNLTVNADGKVILQEDVGNNAHIGKVWQYDPVADKLTQIAQHDPVRFLSGGADFRTQDEESSGVIDVTSTFGDADTKAYLVAVQNHAAATLANSGANFATLVEGGQLLLIKVALNPPVITSNLGGATAAISVAENTTAVTTVTATDDAIDTVTYSLSGTDASKFNIDAATGVLTFKTAPNREAPTDVGGDNVYDVIVTATDGGKTDTQAVAVTVTNVNEAPVITSNGGSPTGSVSIAEDIVAVTTVQVNDPDAGTTLAYEITGGADASLFDIDAATGALTFKTAPDFETPADAGVDNIYNVTVTVSDGALTDTQALTITVTDYLNVVNGTAAYDRLTGSAREDLINGGLGNDRMTGGDDNDIYVVDALGDAVIERADQGTDTVRTTLAKYTLGKNVEILEFTDNGAHKGVGNELDNRIVGGSGNDLINGAAGADIMEGGAGDDFYYVDNAGDTIIEVGGGGNDYVSANVSYTLSASIETLELRNNKNALNATGNDGANLLIGNNNANVIDGKAGIDRIIGGKGIDVLTGGTGADTFVFDTKVSAVNADKITDFLSGTDTLEFDISVFKGFTAAGSVAAGAFVSGAGLVKGADADDRLIYNTTTGDLWYDADGSGRTKAVLVATLEGGPALSVDDLLLVV